MSPKKVLYNDPRFSYSRFWTKRQYENISEQIALTHFCRQISNKNLAADIGAGYGRHTKFFAKIFKKCLLIDPSDKQLKIALNQVKEKNVDIIKSYAENLPFKDNTFDAAFLIRVVHHLEEPKVALGEISRVLKTGGYLVLEFANKTHFLATIKHLLTFNFSYFKNIKPIKVPQSSSSAEESVIYLNFHPRYIEKILEKEGFKILEHLSVSNLRSQFIKKVLPFNLLIFIEKFLQRLLAQLYFGPSIFVLAKKTHT
jgi:ubiquinone/menaquinone biosynthesis C-methylase UbiE